jgi:hypothetical protein
VLTVAPSTDRNDRTSNLLPVWQLLGDSPEARGEDGVHPGEMCDLSVPGDAWRELLAAAARRVPPGGVLLVASERGFNRAFLQLVRHGQWQRGRSASTAQLIRALRTGDFDIEARYSVWPSVRTPRVVLPARQYRASRWVQRSGVLGGGGTRLLARALARSAPLGPVTFLLAPGTAIVARRRINGEVRT